MTLHVLVVDDDPGIRELVVQTLHFEGYEVAEASNGSEALDRIAEALPRVMLLDMRMPVLDGWGVARELKVRGLTLPVVVMTAAQDARRWATEIGADSYLAKPFELDDLVATVTGLVSAQC